MKRRSITVEVDVGYQDVDLDIGELLEVIGGLADDELAHLGLQHTTRPGDGDQHGLTSPALQEHLYCVRACRRSA